MAHPGHHAAHRPDDTAVVVLGDGAEPVESATWAELRARAVAVADGLWGLGLRAGDPVAFCLENRVDFFALVWACQDAGFRYTPVPTRLTADEVRHILSDCGARVVLCSARTRSVVVPACSELNAVTRIDLDSGDAFGAGSGEVPRYERVEGVALLYSSGTTGRPKGVWRAAPPEPIEELPPGDQLLAAAYGVGPGSVYLSTAPLYHSAPLTFLVQMGRIGATTVVMDRFDPGAALAAIERYRVTHSQWVPTMFVRLLRLDEAERRAHDLSSHTFAIHGAGPCPVPVKEAMLDWWGPIIHEYYAGTEGAGTCVIGPQEWLARKGSVGRPIRGRVMILDDDGTELPVGHDGQVWFSESTDFRYLHDDAKTAGVRRADAATFGDLGHLDDDGYLYLTGRQAFTINVGGVNVYPREIELVLLEHPAVADVAVFGRPDDEYGEQVVAVVEVAAGIEPDTVLEAELLSHCRDRLATFKLPRTVHLVDELPREPTGKLRVADLQARYA